MTKEEALKILRKDSLGNLVGYYSSEELQDAIDTIVSRPSLPSNLDEAAEILDLEAKNLADDYTKFLAAGLSKKEPPPIGPRWMKKFASDRFKAGAEWMAGQGWTLEGEVKDQPTGGDDFEIYLDYDRHKMDNILDEICDYVNANYPDDDSRYKVIIQIRKKQ